MNRDTLTQFFRPINPGQDDVHDWDGTPSVVKWHDVYTESELAAVLRLHAAMLAKRFGVYEIAAELSHAADCIEDLAGDKPAIVTDSREYVRVGRTQDDPGELEPVPSGQLFEEDDHA